jgi:hypothetical protein
VISARFISSIMRRIMTADKTRRRQCRCARSDKSGSRKVGMIEDRQEHGRDAVERRAPLVVDRSQDRAGIERLAREDHGGPARQAHQHPEHHAEAVIERDGMHSRSSGPGAFRPPRRSRCGGDCVAERRALREHRWFPLVNWMFDRLLGAQGRHRSGRDCGSSRVSKPIRAPAVAPPISITKRRSGRPGSNSGPAASPALAGRSSASMPT